MQFDSEKHRRRSIRLKGYDYSQPGSYFITICTQDRACLFGEVADGEMRLNDAGCMVQRWWEELTRKFPQVRTDAFVVMPNHVHGIIVIQPEPVGADLRVCPDKKPEPAGPDLRVCPDRKPEPVGADLRVCPDRKPEPVGADLRVCPDRKPEPAGPDLRVCPDRNGAHIGDAHIGAPLPEIVQWFKTMTTNEYIRHVKNDGWPPFPRRLWQRNYYEHIIRNEESLNRIRQYIADNPARWALDRENPEALRPEPKDAWLT